MIVLKSPFLAHGTSKHKLQQKSSQHLRSVPDLHCMHGIFVVIRLKVRITMFRPKFECSFKKSQNSLLGHTVLQPPLQLYCPNQTYPMITYNCTVA